MDVFLGLSDVALCVHMYTQVHPEKRLASLRVVNWASPPGRKVLPGRLCSGAVSPELAQC